MAETPRLNGVIRALEEGKPAFTTFAAAEVSVAQAVGAAHYDGVVFEMEHRAYDIRALRDCLQTCWTGARSCVAPAWHRR